jgi:hypothetical protein
MKKFVNRSFVNCEQAFVWGRVLVIALSLYGIPDKW